MSSRKHYYIPALLAVIALPIQASSVVCSMATGNSTVFTTAACSQEFTPTAFLDWGSPIVGSLTGANSGGLGPATSTAAGGPFPEAMGTTLDAAIDQDAFTITSNDQLERADNTALAWSSTAGRWLPAGFVNSTNLYFSGHFDAPTMPSSTPPFGDNLLGAIAPAGTSAGNPTITLTFTQTLAYLEFAVSSKTNANFTAELLAFNSSGVQIGTYQVQDTGAGGSCSTLSTFDGPVPCNDAPIIQFYDPGAQIKSVELVMLNDLSGVYIDELEVSTIPEPVSSALAGFGLLLLLWVARRKQIQLLRSPVVVTRD